MAAQICQIWQCPVLLPLAEPRQCVAEEEKLCENNMLLRSLDIAPTLYRADPQVTSGRQVSSLVIQIPSITTKWRLLEAQLHRL